MNYYIMAGCTLIFIRLLRPDYCFVSTLLEDEINTHHHGGFTFPSLFPSSEAPHLLSIVSQSFTKSIQDFHKSKRTNVADAFAKAKKGVLLSSDVTARGMDFPGYCSSFISSFS